MLPPRLKSLETGLFIQQFVPVNNKIIQNLRMLLLERIYPQLVDSVHKGPVMHYRI